MLEQMDLMKSIMDFCGGPVQRFVAKRWLKGKSAAGAREDHPEADAQGRRRSAEEAGPGPGAGLHRPELLDELSRDPQGLVRARLRARLRLQPDAGGLARGVRRPDPPSPSREGPGHQHDPLHRRDLSGRIRKGDGAGSSTTGGSVIPA
ncbi:MAG: hypothetical protein MZW92_61570 [Comamonadaceae bacterium]|nr:hypothetical protein [Comamonadaceae bacterium]